MDEKQVNDVANKIMKVGKILTLLITIPFIGFIIFGTAGLIIGIILGVALSLGTK
jgi:hypothetical protein